MKIYTLVGVSIGLAVASLASANEPINRMEQGGADAVLSFCRQVFPGGASAFASIEKSLQGRELDNQQAVKKSAKYLQAYTEVRATLDAAPADWARQACVNLAHSSH